MKNKNRLTIILVTASLFIVTGCKKILEPTIYNSIIATDFPITDADALSALIPFYTQFTPNWGTNDPANSNYLTSFTSNFFGYTYDTSLSTDEEGEGTESAWSNFQVGPSTGDNLRSSGFSVYNRLSYIAKLTDLLDKVNKSNIPSKALFAAEIKALRAWYMFIMTDFYGPLNPGLDPATVNSLVVTPRLSEADYAATMEQDLNDAIAVLPNKYNNTANWGRISKGVASMILLRVEMLEAGRAKAAGQANTALNYWTKAQAAGQRLMGLGYSIDGTYKDVFATPQNSEVIFAVQGSIATPSNYFANILPTDAKTVLGYDVSFSDKYNNLYMPWAFYDKYTSSDTRLETIASSYINTSGTVVDRASGLRGALAMKYPFSLVKQNNTGFEFVIFQYSEVMLSMAEIANELSGPAKVMSDGYLEKITSRAHTVIPPGAATSYETMSNFILDERGRELYNLMGVRRQDLIRHGTYITNAISRGKNAKPYQVLFPIPSDVIIQSNGIIKQNPGY